MVTYMYPKENNPYSFKLKYDPADLQPDIGKFTA